MKKKEKTFKSTGAVVECFGVMIKRVSPYNETDWKESDCKAEIFLTDKQISAIDENHLQ